MSPLRQARLAVLLSALLPVAVAHAQDNVFVDNSIVASPTVGGSA